MGKEISREVRIGQKRGRRGRVGEVRREALELPLVTWRADTRQPTRWSGDALPLTCLRSN